ncbi:MAG: hypothetical protein IT228_15240 [Flavobacteriales bacterium]|nr:hypothetical protein [Flavobacteriales bacterium]NUQ16441.1 hypothetical protein [Flavobacteriales bacterium]
MSSAVFEIRWNRILRAREQGQEELTDFLGPRADLGPLVRLGLLRRRERNDEFQRYHGYVPTPKGSEFLLHIPEKELILVRQNRGAALMTALRKDPVPEAVFKPTFAEPTHDQFEMVRQMREQAGRDVWRVQRADHLRDRLMEGFMDFRTFTKRTGIGEGALLRHMLCTPRAEKSHERALGLAPTPSGERFLAVADPWELLLVKPGMELPLFERCDPMAAAYHCALP